MRLRIALPLLAALSVLPACGLLIPVTCTTNVQTSVFISLVDVRGEPVTDGRVFFRMEDGEESEAECSQPLHGERCGWWSAGWEDAGTFHLRATSADGTRSATAEVHVTADLCHVQTEQVTLTLPD